MKIRTCFHDDPPILAEMAADVMQDESVAPIMADWLDERDDPRGVLLRAWFQLCAEWPPVKLPKLRKRRDKDYVRGKPYQSSQHPYQVPAIVEHYRRRCHGAGNAKMTTFATPASRFLQLWLLRQCDQAAAPDYPRWWRLSPSLTDLSALFLPAALVVPYGVVAGSRLSFRLSRRPLAWLCIAERAWAFVDEYADLVGGLLARVRLLNENDAFWAASQEAVCRLRVPPPRQPGKYRVVNIARGFSTCEMCRQNVEPWPFVVIDSAGNIRHFCAECCGGYTTRGRYFGPVEFPAGK